MSKPRIQHSTPAVDDARRPGLFGGLGKTLATGLALYRGWHA
jgi:hypothetical protein